VDVGEKQGDDVLADASVVVGASAGCLGDTAFGERCADLVRLIVRAFALGAQLSRLADRFKDGPVAVVSFTALEALLACQPADVRLGQTWQLLFGHAAEPPRKLSMLPKRGNFNSSFGKKRAQGFSFYAVEVRDFRANCRNVFSLNERIPSVSC
jgi:hypothetical protein